MSLKKKEESKSSSVDNVFAQLVGLHNKISADAATIGKDMESEVKYWIDSGSMLLNMILSNRHDGGWPSGRIVEVFGKESIGKSTLGYVAMAKVQEAGGVAIYADVERAGNKKFMQMLGMNLDEVVITNENVIEKLFQALENNLKFLMENNIRRDKPTIIVVDSVTALETEAESEGGYEFNMNIHMKKAMMLGKALKKIIPYLNKANACLYLVNQIRDNPSGYGENYVVPGGKSIPFYASIRLHLQGISKIVAKDPVAENLFQEALAAWKAAPKESRGDKPVRAKTDEVTIGSEVTAFTKKNKVAPPYRTGHFRIIFSKGLFDVECYLDYALKYGLLKQSGAWYEFVDAEILSKAKDGKLAKFYASDWLDVLGNNPEVFAELERQLINRLTIPVGIDTDAFSIDVEEISEDNEYAVPIVKKTKSADEDDEA